MTRWPTVARAQTRHLNAAQLIADVVMTAAAGMLSILVLLLASQIGFDTLTFESGLSYASRTPVDASSATGSGSSLVITSAPESSVLSAEDFDASSRAEGDLTDSAQPILWRYPAATVDDLRTLLAANVVEGAVHAREALLDEATAARLGIRVGDDLVVTGDGDGRPCRVAVSGLTRPFRDIDGGLGNGLLVLAADTCDAVGAAPATAAAVAIRYSDASEPAPATDKRERLSQVALALTDVQLTGLFVPVLVVGLGLWLIVSLRAVRRARVQLAPADDLLFDIGCRPALLRATHTVITALIIGVAAVGAAWGARTLLWSIAGVYLQAAHWLAAALLFAAAAVLTTVLRAARARRRTAERPPAAVLPFTAGPARGGS